MDRFFVFLMVILASAGFASCSFDGSRAGRTVEKSDQEKGEKEEGAAGKAEDLIGDEGTVEGLSQNADEQNGNDDETPIGEDDYDDDDDSKDDGGVDDDDDSGAGQIDPDDDGGTETGFPDVLPQRIDFGDVPVGCTAAERTVVAYNNSLAHVEILDVLVEDNPPFSIVAIDPTPPFPIRIESAASIQIAVRYCPHLVGRHSGRVIITTNEGTNCEEGCTVALLSGEGTAESTVVDRFEQCKTPQVDVLWIVDNSDSMSEEQPSLAENVAAYIEYMMGIDVDYHIGVISTEIDDASGEGVKPGFLYAAAGNPKWVDRETPNAARVLAENMHVGVGYSDGREAGLAAAHMALSEPLVTDPVANGGFLRQDAKLSLFFVSDSDDQSPGDLPFYVDFFKQIHGVRNIDLLSASIIVGLDGDTLKPAACSSESGIAEPAADYYEFYSMINNGLALSICDDNWGERLNRFGLDTYNGCRAGFPLSRLPVSTTIEVRVNNELIIFNDDVLGDGWYYEEIYNTVSFGAMAIPPRDSTVEITYQAVCDW